MSETSKAVFLSYASQDAEAATRIAEALRAAGVEVWFDQSELVGGDAWDQKIRKQIRECALLIPVISKATQGRREAYFRLEWKLADERTHLMAKGTPFLLPVTIDETNDREALVPDSFVAVQWTKAPAGEAPPAFAARVKKLLGNDVAGVADPGRGRRDESPGSATPATGRLPKWLRPILATAVLVIAVLGFTLWKKQREPASPAPAPASVPAAPLSEARQLAERATKLRRTTGVTTEGLMAAEEMCNRALVLDPLDAEVWAVASMVDTDFVFAQYDRSDARRQQAQKKAARALALAPAQFTARWAQALALAYASGAPGAKVEAVKLFRALAREGAPGDNHDFLLDFGTLLRESGEFAEAAVLFERVGDLQSAGWNYFVAHDADAAERIADQILATKRTTGGMLLKIFVVAMLREDLTAALAVGEFTPAELLDAAPFRATLYGALNLRQFDRAIALVGGYPQDFILLSGTAQPKRYFSGLAHEMAGRPAAARAEWQVALQQVAERLKTKPNDRDMMAAHALLLACLGEKEEAEREYQLLRNLSVAGDEHFNDWWVALRLGHTDEALAGLTQLLESRGRGWQFAHFAARREVQWDPLRGDPRFEKLLRDHLPKGAKPFEDPTPAAALAPDAKSVAVLPFDSLSSEKDNEYFARGISDELLNQLGRVPGLRVAGRISAFQLKDDKKSDAEIAQALKVAYLVNGSVQRVGSKVRISARLNRAADGVQLWADSFTRELQDIFALQDEIAGLVAQNLQLKLVATPRNNRPVNPEAHRLLLEAQFHANKRAEDELAVAEVLLGKALALDPDFAAAHAALAEVCSVRANFHQLDGLDGGREDLVRAEAEARLALKLDPALAEPYSSLGFILLMNHRWPESEQAFRRALELSPYNTLALRQYQGLLQARGRIDLALDALAKVLEVDPYSFIGLVLETTNLTMVGRYEEALEMNNLANTVGPFRFMLARGPRVLALFELGRKPEAVAEARDILVTPGGKPRGMADCMAIRVLQRAGLADEAAKAAGELFRQLPADSPQRGFVLAALGRFGEAWPFLERTPALSIYILYWSEMFDPVRETPRFRELIAKLGCTEEYRVARETFARMVPPPRK